MSYYGLSFKEVANMLAKDPEGVARYLLPNGKRKGGNWCVGSTDGEEGSSLKVCLSGSKAGVWSDFSPGRGRGGDLLELWRQVNELTPRKAIIEAKEWLGIRDSAFPVKKLSPAKSFERPKDKPSSLCAGSKVQKYLVEERKLSVETLRKYQVGESHSNSRAAIVLPYIRDNDLIMTKTLYLDRPNGKKDMIVTKDAEPSLFGWHVLPEDARKIAITEGEIDAMTLHQYGIKYFNPDSKEHESIGVLSVPFGGGSGDKQKWVEHEFDRLSLFDEIYLCLDSDDEGQAATNMLIERLGRHRCRIVKLPHKDANECLKQGVTAEEIQQCFGRAKSLDPVELVLPSKYKQQVIDKLSNNQTETYQVIGYELPWESARGKICFRPSELSVWTGINGHGKSQLLGFVALHCIKQGAKVCIASMEMKSNYLLDRLLRQASGVRNPTEQYAEEIFSWLDSGLLLFDQVGTVDINRLLEVFKYTHCRYGANVFIVDSLMKFGIAEDDYNGQKAFVEQLCNFKHDYNCHVHLVAHNRKVDDEYTRPGKMDVKGSGAITDLTDNCFTVWRNKLKEESLQSGGDLGQESSPDVILYCQKQRNGEWEGKIPIWFNLDSYQYLANPSHRPVGMVDFSTQGTKFNTAEED